ncbi:hypothetical protein [Umezawaea tangerina]|uniref:Uncharacterized protein n=1 Tax=Umezawaea tangerina TaxID=84725 RepID=A0A2T0SPL2_9PSEU|nr:hypothetical protein [Umezawaea tangerina]PRY35336.1 hypothetical protein CLV43_114254 [Umezawaea tangerina]
MGIQGGLGDALYAQGYDVSGDIQSLGVIGGGPAPLDVTPINKLAMKRIGGLRDGRMEFVSFFNPASGQSHQRFSALPTTDVILTYCRSTILGAPAAALNAKQTNYDPTRGADGSFTMSIKALANGYGLEWGNQLTAGTKTDTGAANGTGVDLTASTSFGLQAYLHVFAFTGTDVTVKLQDSADNASWADIAGAAFTAITTGPQAQRIQTARNATIRRYVRAITVTTGGFTNLQFQVMAVKNDVSVVF